MSSLYDEFLREQYQKESQSKKPVKKIALCGSARFFSDFRKVELQESLAGNVVLSIINTSDFQALPKKTKAGLKSAHLNKIDICDEVLVINRNGYIGKDTKQEIKYAEKKQKPVSYLF